MTHGEEACQCGRRQVLILARLDASTEPRDMNLPGLRLHPLKGRLKGTWAVDVSGNWRVTFRFDGKDAVAIDFDSFAETQRASLA